MFKGTRLGTKLVFAFLVMASVGTGIGLISFNQLNRILEPLTGDIPQSLAEVKRTYHLDGLAQKIRHYDQILTEAAREYVYTGDRQYKYRYNEFEPRLDVVIREAIHKGDEEDKKIFSELKRAKALFVALEYEAIRAVDANDRIAAKIILEGADYWKFKREYKNGLDVYVERRGKEYGESLVFTSKKVDALVADTHRLVEQSKHTVFRTSLFAVLIALLLGAYISRTILKPISELRRGAEFIGKGNLEHRIGVSSDDEIGSLARTFNEMTGKLSGFYTGLEEKVKEKTQELARRVDEIQKQNRALERTKEAMMNILEDLENARLEAEEEKAKYQAILSSIGEGMIATDANGCIMMVNPQAELMLGFESRTMIGKNIGAAFTYENEKGEKIPAHIRPVYQAIERKREIVTKAYYVRKDGSRFPAAVTVSPVIRNYKIIGAIEIFRDISKEKEVDRMKTEFISTVSHELRTPLTVIREGVSLVTDKVFGPVTPEQNEFLSIALKDIDRLSRMINNLLDISKIEAGKVEIKRTFVDLAGLSDEVLSVFATRAKSQSIELKKEYSSSGMLLYADKDKLVEVFTNLIGNALKFTEKGHIKIGIKEEKDCFICSVEDTGRGISKEDMERVFGKFQQFGASPKGGERGTGLGLSIAKGIVELHQGRIWVESTFGKGTTFFFKLPKQTPKEVFTEQLKKYLRDAMHDVSPLSIISVEIPKEPAILGAAAGDPLLIDRLSELISECCGDYAVEIVREENVFYLLLPGKGKDEARELMLNLRRKADEYKDGPQSAGSFPMIVKDVQYPDNGFTGDELISSLKAA